MVYNIEKVSKNDIKKLLQSGNDDEINRIYVFKNGDIDLISGNRKDLDNVLFKLGSFAAGSKCVGEYVDDDFAEKIFNALKINWEKYKGSSDNITFTVEDY